jgi:thioredoxin reductase (NADPH)
MDDPTIHRANIFVSDLRLKARVGVNPGEQDASQSIVLDISVGVEDMALAARSERLSDTLDYVAIARTARQVVELRHYPLVESLATAIAQAVLARPGATSVRVRLRKLDCLRHASAAGVEVELGLDDAATQPRPVGLDQVADPEEVVVVGGGAAGFSACLWCWRLGHRALLVDPGPLLGGQLHLVHGLMADLPAQNPMTGLALARRLWRQLVSCGGRWLRAELQGIEPAPDGSGVALLAHGADRQGGSWEHTIRARTAIVATGVRRRRLEVPGELELAGRGLLATAARDVQALAGKHVVIVGGGDSACENALLVARAGARVTLVHHRPRLSARDQFAREVLQTAGIELCLGARVQRFVGDDTLTGVELEVGGATRLVSAQAALVRVGWIPNSEHLPRQWLDDAAYVQTDASCRVRGETRLLAAGDVLGRIAPSVATAFGSGATAARGAVHILER